MYGIQKKLGDVASTFFEEKFGISTDIHFDVPTTENHGDLTTSAPMQLAKQLKQKPAVLAAELAAALNAVEGVSDVHVASPGYVNVTLDTDVLIAMLENVRTACVPSSTRVKEAPVIVEYSQPNIAKPLGVHHILSTVIGQSMSNLYRHLGYHTVSINHLGDWGTQFGKLAVAYKRWGKKPVEECSLDELLEFYVRFHAEAEKEPALEEEGRAAFLKLEHGDAQLRAFWKAIVDTTMKAMDKIYARLSVSFDHVHGESFYQDKMQSIIDEGKKKKVFTTGEEGALIATFPEDTHLPPAIVVKGDGSTIYLTRDLATIRYRVDTWHPKAILYVVDRAQEMYFRQLFHVVGQLHWELPVLEHVVFGRMRFADKSMSTRKGNILRLEEVLDEAVRRADALIAEKEAEVTGTERDALKEMIGIGSVVYGVLSQNRKMDMVFDWDKALTFEGNSAPYLQYTHARAKSVLAKSGTGMHSLPGHSSNITDSERELIHVLLTFPDVLAMSCKEHLPHKLATFLYELSQAFNSFYNADPILTALPDDRELRLALTSIVATVLKTGCSILTLRVPERM